MARLTILALLFVAISSFAQVTVTNSGFATTPGPAYPAVPVSPPILYTPIVHLGEAPTQPVQAGVANNGVGIVPFMFPAVEPIEQNLPAQNTGEVVPRPEFFDFGVAQFGSSAESVGLDSSGKSLAELAQERRKSTSSSNVRVYTNSDIDQLNQVGNVVNTPSAGRNYGAGNWSPNNGVINPHGAPPQGVISAPDQNQQPSTGVREPLAPKPRPNKPSNVTPNQPQSRLRRLLRPLLQREPVEIAQNTLPIVLTAQSSVNDEDQTQAGQLPRSASKLPLVGVAGLFSISMGIFVRYQRSKSR